MPLQPAEANEETGDAFCSGALAAAPTSCTAHWDVEGSASTIHLDVGIDSGLEGTLPGPDVRALAWARTGVRVEAVPAQQSAFRADVSIARAGLSRGGGVATDTIIVSLVADDSGTRTVLDAQPVAQTSTIFLEKPAARPTGEQYFVEVSASATAWLATNRVSARTPPVGPPCRRGSPIPGYLCSDVLPSEQRPTPLMLGTGAADREVSVALESVEKLAG